jgi:hypothetical protein
MDEFTTSTLSPNLNNQIGISESPTSIADGLVSSTRPYLNISTVIFSYFWIGFVTGNLINMAFSQSKGYKTNTRLMVEISIQIALTNIAAHFTQKFIKRNIPQMDLDGTTFINGGVLLAFAMLSGQSNLVTNVKQIQANWNKTMSKEQPLKWLT